MRRTVACLLIAALVAHTGCVSRVPVDVYPIRRASDQIKTREKVSVILREAREVGGRIGTDPQNGPEVVWEAKEITGQLVTWNDKQIVVHVETWRARSSDTPQSAVFTIPLDQVEQIDRWPGLKPGLFLATLGTLAILVAVSIGIAAAVSKPKPSE
ncbi:MAG: hypothetical protein FJY97_16505 [candidate division Zixibacteria bacterium]|nr:hypothetical protein [candidate division Zixibacteria bacterium]